jgi:hypothetical protein
VENKQISREANLFAEVSPMLTAVTTIIQELTEAKMELETIASFTVSTVISRGGYNALTAYEYKKKFGEMTEVIHSAAKKARFLDRLFGGYLESLEQTEEGSDAMPSMPDRK